VAFVEVAVRTVTRSRFWIIALLCALLVAPAGCDTQNTTPRDDTDPAPPKNPTDALYVCNQAGATVSIIDPDSNAVVRTVDLTEKGFSENAKPHHVVVEPDGSAWYVSLIGSNRVVKFNARNEKMGTVAFPSPGMLSLHPSADRLYAGHTMSIPDVPSTVGVIQRSGMSLVQEVRVPFERPHGMKVSPTGEYAYSSSLSTNDVVAIDTETSGVEAPVSFRAATKQRYVQFDISADGQTAYVTGQEAGQVQILSLENPASPTLVDSVNVGAEPWHPQLSADGSTLYFGSKAINTVYAMSTTPPYGLVRIEGRGIAQPHGSALSPGGRFVYISNSNQNGTYTPSSGEDIGTVVVIDTDTNKIQTVIEVGEKPAGINTRWQP
jgi:DNA-binding beta-propeller fold protein YncE